MFSETRRQIVHIAMSGFALLLPWLTWWQAALCALGALLFNVFVLPRAAGDSLSRPTDRSRGYPLGILLYPLAVLLLILAFPARPDIAAAGWAIMAWGDGIATLAGRAWGRRPLAWNPDKTVEGTLAFFCAAAAAGVFLSWWASGAVDPAPPLAFTLLAPVVAAGAAALAETLPVRLDDNITVPVIAAGVLWSLSLMDPAAWAASAPTVALHLAPAVIVNTVAAVGGWRAGTVRASGMVTGWAIGVVVFACGGWVAWLLLFVTFGTATVASRIGMKRKAVLGIAEERGGRRGGGNAIANTGLAAVAAVLAVTTPYTALGWLAFVAALTTGGSDTVASEIGKAWGGKTYLVTTLSRARPGTPGAMSIEGTAAGVVGAFALASLGSWLGLIPAGWIWVAAAGAVIGSLLESALAATLEGPGLLNNDMLNFINTATGAIAAVVVARLL